MISSRSWILYFSHTHTNASASTAHNNFCEKWDVVYLERRNRDSQLLLTHTNTHMTNDGAIKWFCALNCTVLFINNNFKYVIIYSLRVCVCIFGICQGYDTYNFFPFLSHPLYLHFSSELTIVAIQNSPYMNKLWVIWCGWPQWDVRQNDRQNWCDNRQSHTHIQIRPSV